MGNINKLFNRRNDAIEFVGDYGSMILEVTKETPKEEPKPEPTKAKTKRKKAPFHLHEKFINETKNEPIK